MHLFERKVSKVAICAALAGLFAWPAVYNGQPFLSPDTTAYIRGFDAGMVWLFDHKSSWTSWAAHAHSGNWATSVATEQAATTGQAASLQNPNYIIAGRSVTYGALLYLGELLGALWASVIIQAAVTLAAIVLTLRHFHIRDWSQVALTAVVLGLLTSLPFFVSFMLPDIFAALALLGIANVVAFGGRMGGHERNFWLCILALSAIFHPTHLAMILASIAAVAIGWLAGAKVARVGVLVLLLSAGIGIASELMFNFAIEKILGVQVSRPPIIAARIIADGPGAAYLQEKCPAAGLVMCEFVDRLLTNSDRFLWDTTPGVGVYKSASVEKRHKMAMEQYRFAAAVLAYDPVGQLRSSLSDGLQQLTMIGLLDFWDNVANLPDAHARQRASSAAGQGLFPLSFFSMLTSLVAVSSVVFMTAIFAKRRKTVSPQAKLFYALLVVGQLANALICGALSGPHQRYQARLAWLLPFAALLVYHETSRTRVASRLQSFGGLSDRGLMKQSTLTPP